ncbi:Ig-like domain-containing protein [Roseateles sp.]|uniref:Ig-like domain-containing protein n=1 Tax=Roseateles sp. TaxID=1971397 RepID=UPI003264BFB1
MLIGTKGRRFKTLLAVTGMVLLAACGGGGGGDAGTTPPTPVQPPVADNGLLAFRADNVGRVAGYPLWATELMFRLGQLVADDITTAPGQLNRGGCPSGGQLQRDWSDKDGSQTLSAGDELALQYTGCSRDPLTRGMEGRVGVTLISTQPNGDFDARLILAAPGVAIGYTTGLPGRSDFRITGQLRLTISRTALRQSLTIGDSSDSTISIGFPGSNVGPDRITALRIGKTHRWDEARTYIELKMRYDSSDLGGAYDVATVSPLKSWLDTVPELDPQQGEIRMLGRGGDEARVQVATSVAPGNAELAGWLDQGGDGSREAVLTGTWLGAGIASGVLFADYTRGGKGAAYGYDPNEFTIRPPFAGNSTLPTASTFTIQFTRPVAGATSWRWSLLDKGRLDQPPATGTEVPVAVDVTGAQITVRPATALLYSHRYQLRVDTGESSVNGQLMRATTGGTLSVYAGSIGEFTTPDVLNPQSTLAARLTLKAGTPLEVAGVPPPAGTTANVRYRWTQVSGTPLTISQPGERVAVIALGAGARGIGSSTVRLSVQLEGADQTESADFVLRTLADTSDPWFSRLRIPLNLEDAFTPPKERWSGQAVGTLSASQQADRLNLTYMEVADPADSNGNWSIELRSPDGQALRPGIYANAYSSTWYQRPPGVPTLDLVSGQVRPSSVQGNFIIHELVVDGAGRITKLALDLTAPQGTGQVMASGSVRIDSLVPLPP